MVSAEQKEYFLETLQRKNFNISAACAHCKVSRQWYYDRMAEDVEFSQRVREMEEKQLDDAEEMHAYLRRGILKTEVVDGTRIIVGWEKEPDRHALQFFLLTKGKKRGYALSTPMENTPRPGEVIIVELPDNGRGNPKELPPGESAPQTDQ